MPPGRPYSDDEVHAAIEALTEPGRFDEAQRIVARQAPSLQRILTQALEDADWFGSAHQAEVLRAAGTANPDERVTAMRVLLAEETRLAMLIGVAVGLELANQLSKTRED